jgi:tetratricopeptide (TPR) repeat protein
MFTSFVCLLMCLGNINVVSARAQSVVSQGTAVEVPCCSSDGWRCHDERATALLFGKWCSDGQEKVVTAMDLASKLRLGILELEMEASLHPNPNDVQEQNIQATIGGAEILLARIYMQQDRFEQAEVELSKATKVYRQLVTNILADAYPHQTPPDPEVEQHRRVDLLLDIAVGLIRCGKQLESIALLAKIPSNDKERMYLRAEALFSMGDRADAARVYEEWINMGCHYRLRMFTDDEYGYPAWTILWNMGTRRVNKTSPCENLPPELRARLEDLRQRYDHPKNLPSQNRAPIIVRSTTVR